MYSRRRFSADDDPLTRAMAPPPNETIQERDARIHSERQAKKISDDIDEELKKGQRKGPKPVKILLLGQSESGKTTTLKNFQLMNSAQAFHTEKPSWRAVIQYNVVRSVRTIMEAMTEAQAATHPSQSSSNIPTSRYNRQESHRNLKGIPDCPPLTADHQKLKLRLSPLIQVEETLVRKLTLTGPAEYGGNGRKAKEVYVNSTTGWREAFGRLVKDARESIESELLIDWNDPNDPGVVLHACADDIKRLWNDPVIQRLLEVRKLRIEEVAGFFLDTLDRVTSPRYIPSDDDILRARLKTLGVTEYRFTPAAGTMGLVPTPAEWRIYDVGGQRSLRAAWVPFFDDMNAIIFLAPISCFDQALAEDSSVNRLEDSVLLWKSIVQNPLLKHTNLVLFLNKCDILKAKLVSGIKLGDYIVSYGNRPNDFESASNYLRKKFAAIQKEHSPEQRPFYCHFTSVIDTQSTKLILMNVQDMILRANLRKTSLMA